MKDCEKYQKIDELDELSLETYALIDILDCALKFDEFENNQNTNKIYLMDIIKEKFEKIITIIEKISYLKHS